MASGRWERSMQQHLRRMAEEGARAVELQNRAAETTVAADEWTADAAADQAAATALETEGEGLLAQSNSAAAAAAFDQATADERAARAAEEEAAAAEERGAAAGYEAAVEEDAAQATADASLATRDGFEANGDEVAVGACSVVPVLDVVCDVVGGMAAVGLETAAAGRAARAAAEYSAAVAAQVREDALVVKAGGVQARAARDGGAASELRATAAELRARADEEAARGEADEAAAGEKMAQSAAEREAAEEQEAEAAGEEEAASRAMQQSLRHGALACWDAMMGGLASLVALGFFTLRLLGSFLLPAMTSFCTNDVIPNVHSSVPAAASFPIRTASHVFHHLLILAIVAGAFGGWLATLDQRNIRSRGGILLEVAAVAAGAQSAFLHVLPHSLFRTQDKWHERLRSGALILIRSLAWLWPLSVLELLLLRVNLGAGVFTRAILLRQWYLWALFAVTLLLHYGFVESIQRRETETLVTTVVKKADVECAGTDVPEEDAATGRTYGSIGESTALISAAESNSPPWTTQKSDTIAKEASFRQLLWRDLRRLILPFELLIATSTFALLRQSILSLRRIWPASQAVLSSTHPHWHLAVLAASAASIVTLAICVRASRSSNGATSQ